MELKVLKQEDSIYRAHSFYLYLILWSIFVQFMPIPSNAYQFIAFLLPITIYLLKNKEHGKRILRPNLLNIQSVILIIIIWFCTLPILISIVSLYTHFFGDTLANIISEDAHTSFLGNLFFIAITPAILEEILMRGIILDGYRDKNKFIAALMNGFLFGMLHLNSFQFGHTFIAGFIASYLVFATNSIYAAILIHFINNSFPIFIDFLYPSDPSIVLASEINFLDSIMPVIFSIISIYLLIQLLAKINNIDLNREKDISNEKIFNRPLIISITLFLFFSCLLILII